MGGAGISFGLVTYGYNVIKSIGMKLIKVTPSRGFAIEIGAFLVVIIGTNLGIPLSTTHCKVGATVAVGMCESNGMKDTSKGVNWRLMGKVGSMWVLTLAFASIISSSMFAVLTAGFHPMTKPLDCGLISTKLTSAQNVLNGAYSTDHVEQLFEELDTNDDGELTTEELDARCPPLGTLRNGDDLTVEKFGRRRRRTPEEMDLDDFMTYSCLSSAKLDHMENTQCEPLCAGGYVPDGTLKCKLDGNNEDDFGSYILRTVYSGFTTCIEYSDENSAPCPAN